MKDLRPTRRFLSLPSVRLTHSTRSHPRSHERTQAPKPAAVTSNGAIASSVTVRELEERERQLKRREEELARRERELGASGGGRPKNWPIPGYWVIWHHDIDGDIRNDQVAAAVKMSYYSFLLLTLSLVYNFLFCATAAMFTGMESGFSAWLMALVYMLTGVPGAFYLWYKRLYSAAKNDSAMNYLWFFVVYLVHIAFCFYAFIAPTSAFSTPTYSLAGIMSTSAAMEKNKGTGGVYAFGVCLFGVTLIVSVNAVRMVYAAFRGGGHTLEEARQQARREGIRTAASSAV